LQAYLDKISCEYGNRASLFRVIYILKRLGIGRLNFDVIHVAGTNGKGSVCYKLAKAISRTKKSVALFTSPHFECFTERVQIDFVQIDKHHAFEIIKRIQGLDEKEGLGVCYFDCMCVLAFIYFQESGVSLAIIEVGIGGLHDQTNFVKPLLSIITSIGYDHQGVLGVCIEEIAEKKAGIIKDKTPVIVGPSANLKAVRAMAKKKKAPLFVIEPKQTRDEEMQALIQKAMQILELEYEPNVVKENPPFRFELVQESFVFDVAHNTDALENLYEKILALDQCKKIYTVVTMGKDKDLEGCMSIIRKHSDRVYLFHSTKDRLAKRESLAKHAPESSLFNTLVEALEDASSSDALIVCCGSAYFMSEAKDFLCRKKSPQFLYR
jgi:dihydrofolate synthase / folylpolyglutamate synthase